MVRNLVIMLGITEHATNGEVKKSYARLLQRLSGSCADKRRSYSECQKVRERLSQSYETWKSFEHLQLNEEISEVASNRPTAKLGQILVASGAISLEQLLLLLARQKESSGMRLGEFLVRMGYLDAKALRYYLRIQKLISLPPDHPQRWGQRLIELGLVSEDQLHIAILDSRRERCTLREALIRRDWISSDTLDRIF